MTDADRKRLTEYLGEYWHEPVGIDTIGMICSCGLRSYNAAHEKKYNRTFTTSQDMVDLVKKMVEREEFEEFCVWICLEKMDECVASNASLAAWLLTNPARTCRLIAEWLEQKGYKR